METIKVNMTPNPLDVQTIHASQNDGEARQWGFELHNNGDAIDSSEITDQMVFKAYKGGTEEILPTNTSTPTTSPFLGDIKYPQGLLTDQEFTYRQSPTESDGLAKITDIKGNTIVWNQQMDSSRYNTGTYSGVAVTKSTDETYLIANGTATANAYVRLFNVASFPMISGHKYLCVVPNDPDVAYYDNTSPRQYNNQYSSFVFTSNGSPIRPYARINNGVASTNRRISFMMFDLTQMGLDISSPSEFTSLFSLPYYAYNQGTLLSFNGNGIKTVGKNLFNSADVITGKYVNDTNGVFREQSNSVATNYIEIIPNTEYKIISAQINGMWGAWYDANKTFISGFLSYATAITSPPNAKYVAFTINYDGNNQDYANNVMLLFNGEDETFEPYTSSASSLPISTYFPSGMKSAGNVYDELTESKAITRVGAVDLGSLTWAYQSGNTRFNANQALSGIAKLPSTNNEVANILCAKYDTTSSNNTASETYNFSVGLSTYGNIQIKDTNFTDATAFKTAMSGVYLYYELATPTETSFTTASLVTENAEIPLSNEDGVLVGKCTEQLSENPGFFDAKIKLADADGECYSNKIQLHVERSPQ